MKDTKTRESKARMVALNDVCASAVQMMGRKSLQLSVEEDAAGHHNAKVLWGRVEVNCQLAFAELAKRTPILKGLTLTIAPDVWGTSVRVVGTLWDGPAQLESMTYEAF